MTTQPLPPPCDWPRTRCFYSEELQRLRQWNDDARARLLKANTRTIELEAELTALRGAVEAYEADAVAYRARVAELEAPSFVTCCRKAEGYQARIAELERLLNTAADLLNTDRAMGLEYIKRSADEWTSPSAPTAHTNTPKGAVSVLNPQGTEETGTDRPAAPVLVRGRCDHCGAARMIPAGTEQPCGIEYFEGREDVPCKGLMQPVQRQGTGHAT